MKKRLLIAVTSIFSLVWSCASWAENLIEVYEQAVKSDPTYRAAEAEWLAAAQQSPIARAALLPSFITSGSYQQAHVDQTLFGIESKFPQTTTAYALNLNQSVFNYKAWKNLASANAKVKQAEATYNAAAQDLISRTTTAYFGVLEAYDQLVVTQGQKRALAEQLHQTQEQFKVGLIAVTAVEQVQASYDATTALEIANKNSISDKLEQLRAITGIFYTELSGVMVNLPLIIPAPQDINAWVRIAERQNYNVLAADFARTAARENVQAQKGGHLPVVEATGSYTYENQSQLVIIPEIPDTSSTNKTAAVGVNVNFPIYQGGLVTAQVRQAAEQYAQANAEMEQTLRQTLAQARTSYLGVVSGVSKIRADQQAIHSNQSSLDSTRAAYFVGTATMVDVLQQQTNLFSAQSAYAVDQYAYLNSIVSLKEAAGTLGTKDVALLNSWLGKTINFSAYDLDNGMSRCYSSATEKREETLRHTPPGPRFSNNKKSKKTYAASKPVKHIVSAPVTTPHKKKTTHLASTKTAPHKTT